MVKYKTRNSASFGILNIMGKKFVENHEIFSGPRSHFGPKVKVRVKGRPNEYDQYKRNVWKILYAEYLGDRASSLEQESVRTYTQTNEKVFQ